MGETGHTTVSIPKPLYGRLKELIQGTGFTSVSDFATFVLREIVISTNESDASASDKKKLIREKLKGLGYL